MKYFFTINFVLITLMGNAQSYFQYKFAAADSKIKISKKIKEEVITVLQKKLFKLKYNDVKCFYDSTAKLFVVQTDSSIKTTFLNNDLLRFSKSGFEIYELYNQEEIFMYLAKKDLKKEYVKKNLLFIDISTTMPNRESAFLSLVKFSDTAMLAKDILNFKSRLPSDIIFAQGKLKIPSDKFVEIFGLKNNNNKIITKGLIDTANIGYVDMGYITMNIKFNAVGRMKLYNFTKQNINKTVAMVINNTVLMAPRVAGEINEGSLQISGNFTMQEVTEFVSILTADNLPIKLKFVQSEILTQK